MNSLYADIGFKSINCEGEELCGDHVEVVNTEGSAVIVLADGMGSGVKASILSTLTSKIISTMLASGIELAECVKSVAEALPVCRERGTAYSTFTVISISDSRCAEIIQYDNPQVIIFRNGENYNYPKAEIMLGGKRMYKTVTELCEGDVFVALSDGCPYAGENNKYNLNWGRDEIINFLEPLICQDFTAKTLATILVDECAALYGEEAADDATACVVKFRKRVKVNLLFGPPKKSEDDEKIMSFFFESEGKHILCGGTTSRIAADFLKKPLRTNSFGELNGKIPPVAYLEGADLVTEGIITMSKVLLNAKDYLKENESYREWGYKKDGASLISRVLFEEATDVDFYVGTAQNAAYGESDAPLSFYTKEELVEALSECLEKMGKKVSISLY